MNIKRILSLMLTLSMILTSFMIPAFAAEEEQSADAPYEQAVAVLGALGIMEGKSETDFAPDDYLTRAEMSTIAVRFLGINSEKTGDAESGFTDVDETHWGRPFINTATALDIIHGNGDGTFEPDGETTAEQAIKILVCALGYEPKVATRGEYPAGHLSVAAELGLLKGIDFSDGTNTPIPRWKVAMLVFNALEVDLMDVVVYGETDYSIVTEEKTALGVYHEVEKKYGTVTATYEGSLGGDYADLGEITIDGTEYTTKLNAAKYLGYYVDYYCTIAKGSEKSEVLAIFPIEDKAERIEVDFDDVVSVNVGTGFDVEAEYYDKGGEKKKRVSLVNPVIIYNGKAESFESSADAKAFIDAHMNQGQLVFLQNSKLGARDVLFVENYNAYVVSNINPEMDWISYEIYTSDGTETERIDLSTTETPDRRVFYYDAEGRERIMGNIALGDVIMVYESSDKLVYNIHYSNKMVSGKIERTEKLDDKKAVGYGEDKYTYPEDDTQYKFYVNGEGYEPVKSLYSSLISKDDEVTFLLDCKGKIAGFIQGMQKSAYGLLMDVAVQSGVFGEDTLMVKILDSNGDYVTYETRPEIKAWNGTEVTKVKAASLVTDQLVDPMKDWQLWSTDNAKNFNGVYHTWTTDEVKSDAANRRIIYYETDKESKIRTIIVPSLPETHPDAKIVMLKNFEWHTNPWIAWNKVSQNVGARTLSYVDGTYLYETDRRYELQYQISNFATIYEAVAMEYDDTDYRLVKGGITAMPDENEYDGMEWDYAQLYRYPGSKTLDFMVINPTRPSNGSKQHKVVIVDSIGETVDGYTLEGYLNGEPYSMPIKENTRVWENIHVTSTDKETAQLVTKSMLKPMAENGETPFIVSYESDVMGNQETPYVSPESVHRGDVVRILERDGMITNLEIVRRKSTGVVTMYNATYPGTGMYGALLQWNTCVRGEIVDIDTSLKVLTVKGYYTSGTSPVANVSPSPSPDPNYPQYFKPVAEFTTFIHHVNSGACVYDLETGECYPAEYSDYQVGDEIFTWRYTSSPSGVIIFKNAEPF